MKQSTASSDHETLQATNHIFMVRRAASLVSISFGFLLSGHKAL